MFSVSSFYKLEDDFAFQEGVAKGRGIGKEEGREEGREEGIVIGETRGEAKGEAKGEVKVQQLVAIRLKKLGCEVEFISQALETSEENVEGFLEEAIIEKMQHKTN